MERTIEVVKETIREDGVTFFEQEGGRVLHFGIGGKSGLFPCLAVIHEGVVDEMGDVIVFIAHPTERVPQERRSKVVKYLNELNGKTVLGHFHLSDEGTVFYKASIQIPESQLTQDIVRNLIVSGMLTMDDVYPMISGIIHSHHGFRDGLSAEDLLNIPEDRMNVI